MEVVIRASAPWNRAAIPRPGGNRPRPAKWSGPDATVARSGAGRGGPARSGRRVHQPADPGPPGRAARAGPRTRARLGRLGRPLFGARTLTRGRIGWDVSVLQFLLARGGFAPPHLNGNFGRGTERAVRRFQRAFGLAVDGIAGPATQRALLTGHRRHRPHTARAAR